MADAGAGSCRAVLWAPGFKVSLGRPAACVNDRGTNLGWDRDGGCLLSVRRALDVQSSTIDAPNVFGIQ